MILGPPGQSPQEKNDHCAIDNAPSREKSEQNAALWPELLQDNGS
jgi:hypothetical protein